MENYNKSYQKSTLLTISQLLRNEARDSEQSAASFLNNTKNYLVDTR